MKKTFFLAIIASLVFTACAPAEYTGKGTRIPGEQVIFESEAGPKPYSSHFLESDDFLRNSSVFFNVNGRRKGGFLQIPGLPGYGAFLANNDITSTEVMDSLAYHPSGNGTLARTRDGRVFMFTAWHCMDSVDIMNRPEVLFDNLIDIAVVEVTLPESLQHSGFLESLPFIHNGGPVFKKTGSCSAVNFPVIGNGRKAPVFHSFKNQILKKGDWGKFTRYMIEVDKKAIERYDVHGCSGAGVHSEGELVGVLVRVHNDTPQAFLSIAQVSCSINPATNKLEFNRADY